MNKVTIRDRDYPLALTVQAFSDISDLCPGREISRLSEIETLPTAESMLLMTKMLVIMSNAAEDKLKFENEEYVSSPVTLQAITTLSMPEYGKVIHDAQSILIKEMSAQTVEVETKKKQVAKTK